MKFIFFLVFLPLVFSKTLENHISKYTDVISADVPLVTFDGEPETTFQFKQMNDPVMGGISSGTWSVNEEEQFGVMVGTVRDVPSLHAPGFIKAYADGIFNDASEALEGDLVLKLRSSTSEYTGFRVTFAAGTLTPEHACAGGGVVPFSKGCFKSKFVVEPGTEFSEVRIPFNSFSDHWSPATGDQLTTCAEDASVCPTAKDLSGIKRIEVWGEGIAGDVNLEVKSISANIDV